MLEVLQKAIKEANIDETGTQPATEIRRLSQEGLSISDITAPEAIFNDSEDNRIGLRFKLRDKLLYYINFNNDRERLYISNALEKEIFELTYNRQHYKGFHRTYNRIASSIYMRYLAKYLRTYIDHCLECELN